ncbi:MAG: glycosyltransferase [Candidatus Sumerlaeota bacterium]
MTTDPAPTKPRVSVCMLAYNHAPFVAEAIDSVLEQETDFPVEILIGEDESKDGTREICKEYAEKYPDRIRLFLRSREDVIHINGKPTGRYNLMETLKAARGDYIALLECDDKWIDSDKLQLQVSELDAHPECTICFTAARREFENAPEKNDIIRPYIGVKNQYVLEDFFESNQIVTCTVMYRRGYLDPPPNFFGDIPLGDWPLHLWHAVHGNAFYIDRPTGLYRVHDRGAGQQFRSKIPRLLLAVEVLEKVRPVIPAESLPALDAAIVERRLRAAEDLFNAEEYDNVREQIEGLESYRGEMNGKAKRHLRRMRRKMLQHALGKTLRHLFR